MRFNFFFGYHSAEDWLLHQSDPTFDCESTGHLAIEAPNEVVAFTWGKALASWYTERLHGPKSTFTWSPNQYAAWVESDDDTAVAPNDLVVRSGVFPDYERLSCFLND